VAARTSSFHSILVGECRPWRHPTALPPSQSLSPAARSRRVPWWLYIRKYILLRYEWSAHKSAANLAERRFDFAFASLIFEGKILEKVDDRQDYGEERIVAIGKADGITLTLVYTDRIAADGRPVRRIISARRSNRHEREAYRHKTQE